MLAGFEAFKRDKERNEILRWRHASRAEKWSAIAELMDLAESIVRMRGRPHVPDPLPENWLPGSRQCKS